MADFNNMFAGAQTPRYAQEVVPQPPLRIPFPVDVVRLQSTDTTVVTETEEGDFQVESLIASNTTGTADSVTLYLVESGSSPSPANRLLQAMPVAANTMERLFTTDSQLLIPPGFSLIARGGTDNAISMFGYGFVTQGTYG